MRLSVWAPSAQTVELITQYAGGEEGEPVSGPPVSGPSRRIAMHRGADGSWHTEVDAAVVHGGYRYAVDGRGPYPDPRSSWQPQGVHGASYAAAPDRAPPRREPAFRPKPMREAVIYELHVGTFTAAGTYAGAGEKLRYLADLGVTHVELMPLATFPGRRGWGYDGVDLYAPLPAYGTPAELKRFIESAHEAGLAVLLDVVYNHLGPDGNYLGCYGPYFTDRVKTPWGDAINYDGPLSDEVRRFVTDNACMWLRDYGFDGLRLDAVHAIFSFEARHVLEDLAAAVRKLGEELHRSLVLIAESDLNDPRLVRTAARGGFGLDAHWIDDFHHAIHRFFTGESSGYYADFGGLADVARALRDGYVYQGEYSAFRQRRHGRPPDGVGADQLVVCAQNHDQIGNRARGERLSMLLDVRRLRAIAALTLLSPFVPMLFQGEEWGASTPFLYFTDHQNPELGRAVTEGRKREFSSFGWAGEVPDPQHAETFERSKLDWSEATRAPHAGLIDWHRQLIALRNSRAALPSRAKPKVKFHERQQWLRFEHAGLAVLLNFADAPRPIALPPGAWDLALTSDGYESPPMRDDGSGAVSGHGVRVYRRRA